MAGEWLKFDCALPDKPETLAITVAMGWDDPDLTVGKLMRLFRWFDQHTLDGNAAGVTPALLDRFLSATGFVQAVANAGWIVILDRGLALQNFSRHNGNSAKSRALTAKRVANHRASGGNDQNVTTALAREEKRREEKKEKQKTLAPQEGRFPEFWAIWPKNERKQDRNKCLAKWKAKACDADADQILADVVVKTKTAKWRDGYQESPLVYLNGERWRDGVTPDGPRGSTYDLEDLAKALQ